MATQPTQGQGEEAQQLGGVVSRISRLAPLAVVMVIISENVTLLTKVLLQKLWGAFDLAMTHSVPYLR